MEKNTHTKLFIAESPIKVKTIEKFLGGDYIIRASVGHIADIPERTGTVDVSNAFAATYEPVSYTHLTLPTIYSV